MTPPPEFEAPVLVSTLRVATNFGHSMLREFALRKLEAMELSPIDYVPLAREFGISRWKDKAFEMLVSRAEPITAAEALVLGTETMVDLVAQREAQIRQRRFSIPTSQEYMAMPLAERLRLEDRFRDMLGATGSPSRESTLDGPARRLYPMITRSQSTSSGSSETPSLPKRARVSGDAQTIISFRAGGARRDKVWRAVHGVQRAEE
jgi:hypothetical protein